MAGLRSEVRTESRLVKEALDQFRGVFDTLQASQASVQQELDRARSAARDQADAALRPLLLNVVDLRDRLLAALKLAAAARPGWAGRLLRRPASGDEAWQEGLRMTLRRLDQVLLDRRVAPMRLVGLPFDPCRARVVATAADGFAADGTVIKEDHCPLCRVALNGAETCRRCRAELRAAQRAEREGQVLADAATHCLALGDADTAEQLLRRALLLHAAPETLALWQIVARRPNPAR